MSGLILIPLARVVSGDLYKLKQKTDNQGKPKFKDAAGTEPNMHCTTGLAVKKEGEARWEDTAWGREIVRIATEEQPVLSKNPANFAWKVSDGDSTVPNKNQKVYAKNDNYRGHWLLWCSNGWLPAIVNPDGTPCYSPVPGAIYPGAYVRVKIEVSPHAGQSPGVYLNHRAVALLGDGVRIAAEVDTSDFASAPVVLPAGATAVAAPVSEFAIGTPAPIWVRDVTSWATPAPTPSAPQTPVKPNAEFMAPTPPAAPAPAAPSGPVMTPKANGATYESFRAANWTDAQLREHGYML